MISELINKVNLMESLEELRARYEAKSKEVFHSFPEDTPPLRF